MRKLRRAVREHDIYRWVDTFFEAAVSRELADFPLVEDYLPAAAAFRRRCATGGQLARALYTWQSTLQSHWHEIGFGTLEMCQTGDQWVFRVQVYFGKVSPEWIRVELYADPVTDEVPLRVVMAQADQIPGACNAYIYQATVPASRPAWHFTPRLIPHHPEVRVPMEAAYIVWQR